jgi:hypothetical protein
MVKTIVNRSEGDESLLRRLAENSDESATLAMLIQLCRESPELRHWLWEDFGRDAKVRENFAEVVDNPAELPMRGFIELTSDGASWLEERRRLREQMPAGIYGGLKWDEVTRLIRQFQAGTIDLGVFLLADSWRKGGKASPLLRWAGLEFLELVLPSGRRRLLLHLERTLAFLKAYEDKANRRSMLGYADRWKMHVMFYILRHPAPSYRTRDLCAHAASLGVKVTARVMRQFCIRHGIRRDMRAGRPPRQPGAKGTPKYFNPTGTRNRRKATARD